MPRLVRVVVMMLSRISFLCLRSLCVVCVFFCVVADVQRIKVTLRQSRRLSSRPLP
jgi:hypothetical protein